MPTTPELNTNPIKADEKTWQTSFYEQVFGKDLEGLTVDRNTDGYTRGILFEQKKSLREYGREKALGQALIYLSRFNRDGIPVPAKICLVGQSEGKCYVYSTRNYMKYVEGIAEYAGLKASDGIPGFEAGRHDEEIPFDMSTSRGMAAMLSFVEKAPETVKVHIDAHNVYGWSGFYYTHAKEYKQKPEKKAFFNELRAPSGTLACFIHPWEGTETDFEYIMDLLNDPMTQKKTGAFYTPPEYAELSAGLVRKAIGRAMEAGKKDYVILDRCAGTGNLEMALSEEELSHVIVSTYELKEWMVLRDRFGSQARYIIPPIPKDREGMPDLDDEGFLSGANALSRDILDNGDVMRYVRDPDCAVILYENPPYAETTGIEFQKRSLGKEASEWKKNYVVEEMKKHVSGAATNEMGNAFIWSGFEYFLTDPADSYIVFSPVKYWKAQHLVQKRFVEGYAFNRKHFHAPTPACVMCAYWANEEDPGTRAITLSAIDIGADGKLAGDGTISVEQIFSLFSERYYEGGRETDKDGGIACDLDGTDAELKGKPLKVRVNKIHNNDGADAAVGYLATDSFNFDNPRLHACLTVSAKYNGNGFYLRSDNFMEKLPLFAASRYTDHFNDWKVMSMVMKSADGAERYEADVKSGKLDVFLFRTMFWTCVTHYAHMRSLNGSDGRLYLNQLCFDGDTLAKRKMQAFTDGGYSLNGDEETLLKKTERLLKMASGCEEYNKGFTYGLYQIDEEINVKEQKGFKRNGEPNMAVKYGDINNLVKEVKGMAREYYRKYLADTLFEYEFLK